MITNLQTAAWPEWELGEALDALARTIRNQTSAEQSSGSRAAKLTTEDIDAACAQLGLECEEVPLYAHNVEAVLRSSAPAALRLEPL
jgi:hypothetical protein